MKNETDTTGRLITHLVPWISGNMPGASHLGVTGIEKPGMGLSNETYLFTLTWEEGAEKKMRHMVLRMSPSERVFPDYHLEHQFLVMKALKGSGVPVPEMFWMEKDAFGHRRAVLPDGAAERHHAEGLSVLPRLRHVL